MLLLQARGFAQQDEAIVFKDAVVEKICVEKWDTNGDGKLSYAEAAAVKSLDDAFNYNSDIVSFNEFQYFTGITKLFCDFNGATSLTEVTTPASLKKIGGYSFDGCEALEKVVLNEGVDTLDVYAFAKCGKLESINLPQSLLYIGPGAFLSCKGLTSIEIPSKVKVIQTNAFQECVNLTNVVLGEGLEEIYPGAFSITPIKSLYIPKNVRLLDGVISTCDSLKNISIDSENAYFEFVDKCVYTKDMKKLVGHARAQPETKVTVLDGVEMIGRDSFSGSNNLLKIIIPETVDSIGISAFTRCINLKEVILPKGLRTISDNMLSYCPALESVVIPGMVTVIKSSAFTACDSLKKVVIPGSVKKIGEYAFIGCDAIRELYLYNKTGVIEGYDESGILESGNMTTLFVPKGCVDIYKNDYYWSNAKEIKEIPPAELITFEDAEVEKICVANWDTDGDGKLNVDEAAAVTSLDRKFSENTDIVKFNEFKYFTGVTVLDYDFDGATNLTEITLPSSMRTLDYYSFSDCENLTKVILNEGLEVIGAYSFTGCKSLTTLVIPESVKSIGYNTFYSCDELSSIVIPDKVKSIATNAFNSCTKLTDVTLGRGLETIERSAFAGCTGLTKIYIPANVKKMTGAFLECSNLGQFTVDPDNVNFADYDGHIYSKDLKTFVMFAPGYKYINCIIKNGVTTIDESAFKSAERLITVDIPATVDSIAKGAFARCSKLQEINLPSGLKSIEEESFSYCYELKQIQIPNKVTFIGERAFASCDSLKKVVIPASVKKIQEKAFFCCEAIRELYVYNKTGEIEGYDQSYILEPGNMTTLYVPEGCADIYSKDRYWGNAKEIKEIPSVEIIAFEDAEVEKICVANWDIDGDGKLNVDEAAAVTSLEGKFTSNSNIKTFNEFKYFTGVTETNEKEFYESTLESITLPESMKVLGYASFSECSGLKNVVMNEGLEWIGSECFMYCPMESIEVPDNVNFIGDSAMKYCANLKKFIIPANTYSVSNYLFEGCSVLEDVVMHDKIEFIYDKAFADCVSLKNIHLGRKLKSLLKTAFSGCISLSKITVDKDNEWFVANDSVLFTKDMKSLLHYCIGSKATEYTIPDGVEILGRSAFDKTLLKKIIIPESVVDIQHSAFSDCINLESIDLPESVTSLSPYVFMNCKNLKSVNWSSNLAAIEHDAFYNCESLERIVLPATFERLGVEAFIGCMNMNEIVSYSETGEFTNVGVSELIPTTETGENMRVVYVPYGCKATYEAHPYWSRAHEIIEMEPTAIEGVEGAEGSETVSVNGVVVAVNGSADIYSADGVLVKRISAGDKVNDLPAGIYIINGKKVVVR